MANVLCTTSCFYAVLYLIVSFSPFWLFCARTTIRPPAVHLYSLLGAQSNKDVARVENKSVKFYMCMQLGGLAYKSLLHYYFLFSQRVLRLYIVYFSFLTHFLLKGQELGPFFCYRCRCWLSRYSCAF